MESGRRFEVNCWSIARRSKSWLASMGIIILGTVFSVCIIAAAWSLKMILDDQVKTTYKIVNDTGRVAQVEPTQLIQPNQTLASTDAPTLRQKRSWGSDLHLELESVNLELQNVSINYSSLERKKEKPAHTLCSRRVSPAATPSKKVYHQA